MYYFCGTSVPDNAKYRFKGSDVRYALYNVNDRVLSFATYAKVQNISINQQIRGFEQAYDSESTIVPPSVFADKVEPYSFIVQSDMDNERNQEHYSDIMITVPLIFDKLFAGVIFVYKYLRVRVYAREDKVLCLNIEPRLIDIPLVYNDTESITTYVECLEELADCLGYNNDNITHWTVTLPQAKYIDLSLLDELTINGKDIFMTLNVDTKKTDTLKLKRLNKHTIKFAGLFENTKTLKELDLTCIKPSGLVKHLTPDTFIENTDGMKKLVFITSKLMGSFSLIKFSIDDNEIVDEIITALNRGLRKKEENRVRATGDKVYIKNLGVCDKNADTFINLPKTTISAMCLMGMTNTVFIVNVK